MRKRTGLSSKKRQHFTQEEIQANLEKCNKYFDINFQKSINENVCDLIAKKYFRATFIGFDELPERRAEAPDTPIIFISNHSGMAFPWDAIIFGSQYNKMRHYGRQSIRPLTAPALSRTNLMNPYLVENMWKRVGGVDASVINFESMMQQSHEDLLIFPEGVPGIGKGFEKRYQLQRFATSFVRMALKYKADIIPYVTVNGEYINPYSYRNKKLDKLVQKLGVPYIPVGLSTIAIPLQPWTFYMGFPAHLIYVKGERIKIYDIIDKPYEALTYQDFKRISLEVHAQMQAFLTKSVQEYGQKPFNWRLLAKSLTQNLNLLPAALPITWHIKFSEFERRAKKQKPLDIKLKVGVFFLLKHMIRNPFTIVFFIPILGWIPIMIKNYIITQKKIKQDYIEN